MRLLILHDSADFGGHERIFLSLFPSVLESGAFEQISFVLPKRNEMLARELSRLGAASNLSIERSSYEKRSGEPYFAPFRLGYARYVRHIAAGFRPDRVLLLHGRIEHLATPALHLRRQVLISYIPMAHSMAEMQRRVPGGDLVRRLYYSRPDRFIVPSSTTAAELRRAGARGDIRIVRNVVSPPPRIPAAAARRQLGLPVEGKLCLYMGRFDQHQKGIDRLLAAIRRGGERLSGMSFLFVGGGPAESGIRAALQDAPGISGHIIGWTDTPHLMLSAADVLLAPSRFEGVPLVMLEAMTYELPVLASKIEVYREHLPPSHLLDFDTDDLASAIARVTSPDAQGAYAEHCRSIINSGNLEESRRRFVGALMEPVT